MLISDTNLWQRHSFGAGKEKDKDLENNYDYFPACRSLNADRVQDIIPKGRLCETARSL